MQLKVPASTNVIDLRGQDATLGPSPRGDRIRPQPTPAPDPNREVKDNLGGGATIDDVINDIVGGDNPRERKANRIITRSQFNQFLQGDLEAPVHHGNIDLDKRQVVQNPDGSISTEESISFEEDGLEVLIPTVFGGKHHEPREAIEYYRKTGEHLGKFRSPAAADMYARALHERQERVYRKP